MSLKLAYSKHKPSTPSLSPDSDQQLWYEFRAGNREALAAIYQQHFFKLYNYGMKISRDEDLVKDCIQDLFIYIWKHRAKLSDTDSIKYYLFRALRRKITDSLTQKSKGQPLEEQHNFVFELPYEHILIETQISQEQKQKVIQCLNNLPKRQKEALFLRYYENMKPQEVASIMSLTVESAYALLSKALHHLRQLLQKAVIYMLLLSMFGNKF